MKYEEFVNWFINEHMGHGNAIERFEMKLLTKNDDRINREYIARAWEENFIIINDGNGYFLVDWDDMDDIRLFMKYMRIERARSRTQQKKMAIGEKWEQKVMDMGWTAEKRESVAS